MAKANYSIDSVITFTPEEEDARLLKVGTYVIHLIACALHGAQADPLPEGLAWEDVHKLAASNGVASSCWRGVKTRDDVPADLRKRWELQANNALYRRLMFDEERKRVFAAMEERGLSYLPLKGVLLADYYPHPEMRAMCDNDILYGFVEPLEDGGFTLHRAVDGATEAAMQEATRVMCELMEGLGYDATVVGYSNADCFQKKPFFNFEMHRVLMEECVEFHDYYANPWLRAVQSGESPFAFSFSLEDEYVYEIAHAYKHFYQAGCGIRCMVDQYVFLQKEHSRLDWEYIDAQLDQMGMLYFEKDLDQLGQALLESNMPLGEDQQAMLAYMLGSGAYGSLENLMAWQMQRLQGKGHEKVGAGAKLDYIKQRLSYSEDVMKAEFPFFYRHKKLRFLLSAYRLSHGAINSRKKIASELRNLRKM